MMRFISGSVVLATVALACSAPTFAQSPADVSGVGQKTHIDCRGGEATVSGTENDVHITGNCRRLTVSGTNNDIRVAMAPNGIITISGTDNVIDWSAPGKATIRRNVSGVDNQVRRAR